MSTKKDRDFSEAISTTSEDVARETLHHLERGHGLTVSALAKTIADQMEAVKGVGTCKSCGAKQGIPDHTARNNAIKNYLMLLKRSGDDGSDEFGISKATHGVVDEVLKEIDNSRGTFSKIIIENRMLKEENESNGEEIERLKRQIVDLKSITPEDLKRRQEKRRRHSGASEGSGKA